METKADNPVDLLEAQAPAWIRAYFEFNHLKQLYRQGWLQAGVPRERCESVAEHTFGVVILAWLLTPLYAPELDAGLILKLAILHDTGEIYTGDLTPQDDISARVKHQSEQDSIERIFSKLPGGEQAIHLWQVYEQGESREAIFVKCLDRLEMALQASIYSHQGFPDLESFFETARRFLKGSNLQPLMQAVDELKPASK